MLASDRGHQTVDGESALRREEAHFTGVELHRWVDLALNMPGCPNNAVIQQGCYLFAFGTYSTPFLS